MKTGQPITAMRGQMVETSNLDAVAFLRRRLVSPVAVNLKELRYGG